jgi:hypothetical protein
MYKALRHHRTVQSPVRGRITFRVDRWTREKEKERARERERERERERREEREKEKEKEIC